MNVDLEAIRNSLGDLAARDITHNELGELSGFHEAEKLEKDFANFLEELLDLASEYGQRADQVILEKGISTVETQINQMRGRCDEIDKLVAEENVHKENFPDQRKQQIEGVRTQRTNIHTALSEVKSALRVARLEALPEDQQKYQEFMNEIEKHALKVQEHVGAAEKALSTLQDRMIKQGIEELEGTFAFLRGRHATRERWWFVAFLLASAAFIVAVGDLVFFSPNLAEKIPETIALVFRRVLMISVPAIAMKFCSSKYNLERNLHIVYDHRETVLQQYKLFEEAISDQDREAKNQFRLEIARYVFADPTTGYIDASKGGELNINPVVGTFERVASAGAGGA